MPFSAANMDLHWVSTKVVDEFFKRSFRGISPARYLRLGYRTMPDWLATFVSLQPCRLVCGYCHKWQSQTRALPFKLDTVGPWFVEFTYVAAKAPNGTPGIGVVDAAPLATTWDSENQSNPAPRDVSCWMSCDLSRRSNGHFAMSLSPYDGTVFAMWPQAETCKCAQLNWHSARNQLRKWNGPLHCGFLLENNSLTFFRRDDEGYWHSGESVCKTLPSHVLPCMFMSSYVGFSLVRFECLRNSPPGICPHCDAVFHGFAQPFRSWP